MSRIFLDSSKCVFQLYKDEYLRRPTLEDIQRLYAKHEELHGFPGMLESIDCMHWPSKICPKTWQGKYTCGDHGHPTIMLEAVASYDLWIWHAYFVIAGSNNDINVLNNLPLFWHFEFHIHFGFNFKHCVYFNFVIFREIIEDRAPDTLFTVNKTHYRKGYYLADDIYPEWSTFVKAFSCPQDDKKKKFKKYQEKARKDVEHVFGCLQKQLHILSQPARARSVNRIFRTMYACVILHNMIVEDSGYVITLLEEDGMFQPPPVPRRTFQEIMAVHQRTNRELRDQHVHHTFRHDLTKCIGVPRELYIGNSFNDFQRIIGSLKHEDKSFLCVGKGVVN
uniref:uncharacterized protein LOC122596961 n=1 Tax=Erigeron canadensis TaxID=72917 RepID=UPI001CB8CEA6|nr:uncharacterized protein LOC122596961 [Erigeron canadensis]